MRKRTSRRRWKARARLGQKIPWSAIVDHRLKKWGQWERRFGYMDAYLLDGLKKHPFEIALDKIIKRMEFGYPTKQYFVYAKGAEVVFSEVVDEDFWA